jgi:hypothetical protein
MSAQMLQSLQGAFSGGQSAGGANMAPDMGALAQQFKLPAPSGAQTGSLAPDAMDPMQIIAQNMQQQMSPTNIAMQGLGQVGSAFIDKNVEPRHQMPLAPAFGMATSQMGPLQLSPLLNYLKGL